MRKNPFGYYDLPGSAGNAGLGIPNDPGGGVVPPPAFSPPPASAPSVNPAAAPVPPPPTDYASNILNDPLYRQNMANLASQGIQSAAERKAATDRALIQFGEIPNFTNAVHGLGLNPNSPMFKFLSQDIDEATQRSARGLTRAGLSTVAKLDTGHKTALDNLMSTLAARGIVRSGSTGVGVGLENHNYLDSQFQARNQLLDYLSGVQAAFAQSEQARQQQQAGYASDAAGRQQTLHPGTDTSGTWSSAINDWIPDSQWFGAAPGINYSGVNPWEGR